MGHECQITWKTTPFLEETWQVADPGKLIQSRGIKMKVVQYEYYKKNKEEIRKS